MSGKLTEGFQNIIELPWSLFVDLETSADATNFDSIVTALARAASKGNLRAIQAALDRLDGKIATEVEVEFPKFYMLFPNAVEIANAPLAIGKPEKVEKVNVSPESIEPLNMSADPDNEDELPTGSLRAVLDRMLNSPKSIVDKIIDTSKSVDAGDLTKGNPMVKSVIVAGLMKLVHEGKISAVFEVFDQIDGKVAEKIKILGDDVYMYNYSKIAPIGAEKNEDGIYQMVAENTTNAWVARLEEKNGQSQKNR